MYANVNNVYEILRRIYNKQQHGFFSFADFNRLAENAQKEVFDNALSEYRLMLNNKRRYLSNWKGVFTSAESLREDLKTLMRTRVVLTSSSLDNIFQYPEDYAYLVSLSYGELPISIVPQEDIEYALYSELGKPSTVSPIALQNHNSIEVFPDTITSGVKCSYYKIPQGSDALGNPSSQSPTISTTNVGGKEIYNPSTSINFELPETMQTKIVIQMLQYLGINMREQEVEVYSQGEEVKEDREII